MAHKRRAHQRRYPKINGYRKPGMVDVRGSDVNDGEADAGGACCGCVILLLVALIFAAGFLKQAFN
jgi:hypothetical protein